MKRSRRRTSNKCKSRAIIVYFPSELIKLLDEAAAGNNSDRNQFICVAIREKIGMAGS
jgi:metal-responsive CopG/Arc/MetJ family transcriptional regulator